MAALGLFIACMVGGMSYTQARDRHALETRGVRTEAVVVRLEHHDHRHGWFEKRRISYPVFAFTTAEGRTARSTGREATYAPQLRPGQLVPVVYDLADPTLVQDIASFDAYRAWPDLLLTIPLMLVGIGLAVIALVRPGYVRPP